MKDKRLEKEFDEYFKGVSTPDNITADAKKFVKPKNSFMPKLLKLASVMASCVLVITLTVIIFVNNPSVAPPNGSQPPASGDITAPAPACYYDTELTLKDADAYALTDNRRLKLISKLAHSDNASVSDCVSYYSGEELVLFSAKVDMLYSLTRYESEVYIEFVSDKVYAPLKDYAEGAKGNYRGVEYYITQTTAENGEPQFKLCAVYKGVKYYFDIISSDEQAYMKYLEFVVKNY